MHIENENNLFPESLRNCSISDFEEIFRTYYRQLYLYAYGFIMDEMEAEDIVQNAFSIIWEKRGQLPNPINIKAYLYTSVKHACFRYFQHLKLTDNYQKRQAEALVLSFAEDLEDDNVIVQTVKKAMKKLTAQQALMIEMHVMNGLKYEEIAKLLGISENTVRTHLKRAYKILREQLSSLIFPLPLFFYPN